MALVSMLLLSKARVLQELSVPYRQGAGWNGKGNQPGMLGTGTCGRLQKLGPLMQKWWVLG